MNTTRKLRSSLTAAALVCGTFVGGVGVATPASASGPSCPAGAAITNSYDFKDSSGRLAATAYTFQYAKGACTYLVARGPYSGMYKWMDIQIKDVYSTGQTSYDGGHYYYYAGPVSIWPGNGNCLEMWFDMQNSAGNWVVKTTQYTNCD